MSLDKKLSRAYLSAMTVTPETAAKRAIDLLGGVRNVARHLDLTTQAVYQWNRVPADKVLQVEALLDGQISRHDLRPDIFGERA